MYDAHDYSAEKGSTWSLADFTIGYREHRMDELDQAFDKLVKKPIDVLGDFIRANATLFHS